ncbi:MAG: VOC family protein [Actinomycetota bacterium]|nr:VOC family protein [Actinomycetota bacterium]|tara:strand:- start:2417 stop:2890 length:474 start_codon:yes stop_codon:yes gene_type:complete
MFDFEEIFHIGIRVPNIETAMEEMGESLNVTWAELVENPSQGLWTPDDGQQNIPLKFVYSREGDQHLELLEGQPGSFWDGNENPGVHHFGVWVDDVKVETERLLGHGWDLLGAAKSPAEGFGNMTYLAPSNGTILELVASINKPRFERWWGGGSFYD